MAQPHLALTPPPAKSPELPTPDTSWKDVVQLLRRAAQLAAERDLDSELFMQAAWAACLDARPGLREQLEDKELRSQLKKLRKRGLVANA
jgi:hypothetical protein